MSTCSFNCEGQKPYCCCWDHTDELMWVFSTRRLHSERMFPTSPAVINSYNLCFHLSKWQHQLCERTSFSHIIGQMHIHAATTVCVSQGTSSAIWGSTTERSRIPAPSATRPSPRNRNSVGTCFPTQEEVSSVATAENRWGTRTAWSPTRGCTLERDPIAAPSVEKVRGRYWKIKLWGKKHQRRIQAGDKSSNLSQITNSSVTDLSPHFLSVWDALIPSAPRSLSANQKQSLKV